MDLSAALNWEPPPNWEKIVVVDSHTGGEPFRVVLDGLPPIDGEDVLSRRRYAEENLERLRTTLIWEPRGHADMYGGWLSRPVRPDSDLSVLFVHNAGFSTMCGHGIIALVKVVLDMGILEAEEPETTIRIDTPAGQVTATATVRGGETKKVSFRNVASFVVELDAKVVVDGLGTVGYDLAFGGAFYAYVDSDSVGVDLSDAASLIAVGRRIKGAITDSRTVTHPESDDLGFLYGVIFTGKSQDPASHHRSVCVFADGEVDRSPTGTGVSGSLAILHARSELAVTDTISVESIVGSVFEGRIAEKTSVGGKDAVIPEISGHAHIVGRSELWVDPEDPLGNGFFIR